MIYLQNYEFDEQKLDDIKTFRFGRRWPVVYILHDQKKAYIGQTVDVFQRSQQHYRSEYKKDLTTIEVISDKKFNKSVTIDFEARLIEYMYVDGKYELLNGNTGERPHNYYQREDTYDDLFKQLWRKLKKEKLVETNYKSMENSNYFKFSPFKALTDDQYNTIGSIFITLYDAIINNKPHAYLVNGGPGTGKTVLAVHMMKAIVDATRNDIDLFDNEDYEEDENYYESLLKLRNLDMQSKIALVISMTPLRNTLKKVFEKIPGLSKEMVISPQELKYENEYDILLVDEAHRLTQYKNISNRGSFKKKNIELGFLDNEGTQFDWIRKCSRNQIFFYDKDQSVRPSDIPKEVFTMLAKEENTSIYNLETQMRCLGGDEYLRYVRKLLQNTKVKPKEFKQYDLKLFEDIQDMVNAIKKLDRKHGLCRNVAGFAWTWKDKGSHKDKVKRKSYDIHINSYKYMWNTKRNDWVNSTYALDEIGCIHTIQGYDLNYAGVIIGKDLYYDKEIGKICASKDNYYDTYGKNTLKTPEELFEYICRIYYVLMTRGIRGTYLYVCDDALREYLSAYFPVAKKESCDESGKR